MFNNWFSRAKAPSVCPFLRCKYYLRDQFQTTKILSLNPDLGRDMHNQLQALPAALRIPSASSPQQYQSEVLLANIYGRTCTSKRCSLSTTSLVLNSMFIMEGSILSAHIPKFQGKRKSEVTATCELIPKPSKSSTFVYIASKHTKLGKREDRDWLGVPKPETQ